jgi:hypothetical protein
MDAEEDSTQGPDPNDPATYDCALIDSDLLHMVHFPTRSHSPFISRDWPRIIPTAALVILHAIHGSNDIRRARAEYFIASAIGIALNTLHINRLDVPLATLPPVTSRDSASQDVRILPSTLLWRFFLHNPFFLLHAFTTDDTHQAVSSTTLNLLVPCPFCYCKLSNVRDYFRGTFSCPRAPTDLEGTRRASEAFLYRLQTNKALLLHCGTVELSRSFPESECTLFVAAHRLLAETIEQIRDTFQDEFLPWLDEPISHEELSYLRESLQDYSYKPDLVTKHPDATQGPSPPDTDTLSHSLAHGAPINSPEFN